MENKVAGFKKYIQLYITIAGFAAVMTASAGIALFPGLASLPLKILYPGKIKIVSRSYSSRRGGRGVSRNFYRHNKNGRLVKINGLIVILISALFYYPLFAILMTLYLVIKAILKKK
jgi:hypothetical protein